MERSSRALTNIAFGLILKMVTMIGPFAVRVIITRTIGEEYLGVSGVFSSILSALALTEMGFASAIAYRCYSLYANLDYESIQKYLAFFKKVYQIIGSIIITLGILVIPFLKYIVKGDLPSGLNMYLIYLVYLINTGISYFFGAYKSVVLTISQRQDIESRIALLCNSLMYVFQILVLLFFHNYYVYLIFLPISTVFVNFFRIKKTKEMFPEMFAKGNLNKEEKKAVFKSIVPLFGHRLQGTIVVSADNIVISSFIGVVMVAKYNNYYLIIAALASFVIAIYAAVQPGIGNAMAVDDVGKNYSDFKKLSFGINWIVGWMSICLICLFEDFIEMAYGVQSKLGMYTVILLAVEFYIWHTFDILMTYRDVIGSWSGDMYIPYISGAFNLVVNITLVKILGLNGVIISTILSFVCFSIPFSINVLFRKEFKISEKEYLLNYLKRTLTIVAVAFITYFTCSNIVAFGIEVNFILKGVICLILPNVILLILWCRTEEFKYFYNIILTIVKRGRKSDSAK